MWKPSRGAGARTPCRAAAAFCANLITLVACAPPPSRAGARSNRGSGAGGGWGGPERPPAPRELMEVTSRATLTFSFLPFSFVLFSFLFSLFFPLSPFCSRDAAKRKAWKLNRVGSLRNIYSSSTNTEGNAPPPPSLHARQRSRLPPPPPADRKCESQAACTRIVFADSFLWSFHLFVCVFYFTIHVPFSLLKF